MNFRNSTIFIPNLNSTTRKKRQKPAKISDTRNRRLNLIKSIQILKNSIASNFIIVILRFQLLQFITYSTHLCDIIGSDVRISCLTCLYEFNEKMSITTLLYLSPDAISTFNSDIVFDIDETTTRLIFL